jgi:flagellar hook-associated protein 1 FlgK
MGFSSINTALSALRYNQLAMDTASQNIANVSTEGYARRRVESASAGTPTTSAMWSRSQTPDGGVRITGITRMTDAFLDARGRTEHGKQSYLDTRQAVLDRLETGMGEPGDNGVAAVMAEFRSAWSDLANNPANDAARSQVLARGSALADAVAIQSRNFTVEAGDQRVRLNAMVTETNTLASDLAATNKAIQVSRLDGSEAGNLLDQRDLLALRLSELTGGTAKVNDAGGLDFAVNGVALVTGGRGGRLDVTSGVTPTGAADGAPIRLQVVDPVDRSPRAVSGLSGEVGAVIEVLDTTIPGYLTRLGDVAKQLADSVNAIHRSAYDAEGGTGADFFAYDPADPAGTLAVLVTDPAGVAASGVPGGAVDGSTADLLAELTGPESAYQQVVNGFGTEVASGRRLAASQQMLTQQVDGSRDQLAGVSLDEEMLSMVQYQRGYEAAARVLTTVDSMLDTLINRTGLMR